MCRAQLCGASKARPEMPILLCKQLGAIKGFFVGEGLGMKRKLKPKGPEREGSYPQSHSRLLPEYCHLSPFLIQYCRGPRAVYILFLHCLLGG